MTKIDIQYYINGQICYEYYYLNGESHREDGAAKIGYYQDGMVAYEHYYLNGILHREGLPAVISYDECGTIYYESYYLNGKLHREDGPSYIAYYKKGNKKGTKKFCDYFLYGKEYTDKNIIKNWVDFCKLGIYL